MVALVNIVKTPDSPICLTLQVTMNILKSVNISTLQGFCYFRNFRQKKSTLSAWEIQQGPPPALGVSQGWTIKTLHPLAILIELEMG